METQIHVVTSAKGNKERRRPAIKLSGKWLFDAGFQPNMLIHLECAKNTIWFKLCDTATISHLELSKKILKSDAKGIFHVGRQWRKKVIVPSICLSGFWLEKFGFTIGGILAVKYEHGIITIRLIELEENQTTIGCSG